MQANTEAFGPRASNRLSLRPIALIGFMGVGKSAVGRRLARMLDYEFVDTDRMIEESEQRSIADIFASDGETFFRDLETRVLEEALSDPRRVISTGGGIALRQDNLDLLMDSAAVVLLTAAPQVILSRVQPFDRRPLLKGHPDPLKRIVDLMHQREKIYSRFHLHVDTSNGHPGRFAATILEWYRTRSVGGRG